VRRGNNRLGLALFALIAIGCSRESEEPVDPAVARGEKIYRNICLVCHNADPNQPGSIGPAIAGASRELLEARLLHGGYPPGYTPKRPTQQMPRFEFLAPNIDDIAAYLASQKK